MAYLFAVFRSRPSPFYLMDEVEAALDDVNLMRFLALVNEFREEAQLIIVSHQKRTMEAADALYGVTMAPGGSSKVVSQKVPRDRAAVDASEVRLSAAPDAAHPPAPVPELGPEQGERGGRRCGRRDVGRRVDAPRRRPRRPMATATPVRGDAGPDGDADGDRPTLNEIARRMDVRACGGRGGDGGRPRRRSRPVIDATDPDGGLRCRHRSDRGRPRRAGGRRDRHRGRPWLEASGRRAAEVEGRQASGVAVAERPTAPVDRRRAGGGRNPTGGGTPCGGGRGTARGGAGVLPGTTGQGAGPPVRLHRCRPGTRGKIDGATWDDLEEALIRADVGVGATDALLEDLRSRVRSGEIGGPDDLVDALRSDLVAMLTTDTPGLAGIGGERPPAAEGEAARVVDVWLFVGVNGVGKTTTVGKVATRLSRSGTRVLLAAGDTFRAAAGEQLTMWADRAGADIVRGAEGGDPSSVVFDAVQRAASKGVPLVLADTAGRLHNKVNLIEELKKIRRVSDRPPGHVTEVLLVLDATTGQNGLAQAKVFLDAVDVSGVVLTKLDGTAKGGIVVAIQRELGLPVKLVGLGEGADDLVDFDPQAFVDALF